MECTTRIDRKGLAETAFMEPTQRVDGGARQAGPSHDSTYAVVPRILRPALVVVVDLRVLLQPSICLCH